MYKRLILTATVLLFSIAAIAQEQETVKDDNLSQEDLLPQYMYCELTTIGNSTPSFWKFKVIFDFGQATEKWKYNWLTNKDGKEIKFNSVIEALNYMGCFGWEFVQAYSVSSDNNIHYILRIKTTKLTDGQKNLLLKNPVVDSNNDTEQNTKHKNR